jgi:hypothetical protein
MGRSKKTRDYRGKWRNFIRLENPEENRKVCAKSPLTYIYDTTFDDDEKNLKIYHLDTHELDTIFNQANTIDDFIDKLKDPIKKLLLSKPHAVSYMRKRCYMQIKLKLKYWHDKAYAPEEDTATPTFYNEGYCRREFLLYDESALDRVIPAILDKLKIQIDNFEFCGSGWILVGPLKCTIRLIKHEPKFNKSGVFIPTPEWLKDRRAIINIKNKDNNCFFKCIYRYFNRDTKNRHDYYDIDMIYVR